jgi:hypothetical protein
MLLAVCGSRRGSRECCLAGVIGGAGAAAGGSGRPAAAWPRAGGGHATRLAGGCWGALGGVAAAGPLQGFDVGAQLGLPRGERSGDVRVAGKRGAQQVGADLGGAVEVDRLGLFELVEQLREQPAAIAVRRG